MARREPRDPPPATIAVDQTSALALAARLRLHAINAERATARVRIAAAAALAVRHRTERLWRRVETFLLLWHVVKTGRGTW